MKDIALITPLIKRLLLWIYRFKEQKSVPIKSQCMYYKYLPRYIHNKLGVKCVSDSQPICFCDLCLMRLVRSITGGLVSRIRTYDNGFNLKLPHK